jgi:radical SAM PhpK family P-methyltransferase
MISEIDCLLVGTNQLDFNEEERMLRILGTDYAAYREMNNSFIQYKSKLYTAQDIFNLFNRENKEVGHPAVFFSFGSILSPTIAYLGTYLHRRGYTFDYVNWIQDEKEELIKKLKAGNILTVGITTTLYPTLYPIIDIVSLIRKYNSSVKIIVGGTFIHKSYVLQSKASLQKQYDLIGADYYIINQQGETALTNLIHAIKNNLPLNEVHNIVYKEGSTYVYTHMEDECNILEENMVDWSLFSNKVGSSVALRTGISCPFSCGFCLYPRLGGKYQTVSIDAIEKELDDLDRIGRTKSIYFIDDTFNVPPNRFKEILMMMIRKKYRFKWHSFFRCQYADPETVELMKESGCEGVLLGIESGSQTILDNMNKSVTVEQYKKGIGLLKKYGIPSLASFLIGFPGETRDTFKETMDFIEEVKPDFYQAFVWYCAPGSPIWNQKEKYKLRGTEFSWSHNTMDAQTACDLVNYMFLNIKNSVWIPKHNFHSDGLFYLHNQGISMEQIREFFHAFNTGVAQKLLDPEQQEISAEVAERIKNACTLKNPS